MIILYKLSQVYYYIPMNDLLGSMICQIRRDYTYIIYLPSLIGTSVAISMYPLSISIIHYGIRIYHYIICYTEIETTMWEEALAIAKVIFLLNYAHNRIL